MSEIENKLLNVIENKYKELKKDIINKNNIFWKIKEFEGNAIGQIGESFVRDLVGELGFKIENKENTHDEYDIKIGDIKIEIKTARKGIKNNTFQFNGFNPKYNYSYIIFIGIALDKAYYRIVKANIEYTHKDRKYTLNINDKDKKLVAMNPESQTNYKITLTNNDLLLLDNNFKNELKSIINC
ncbi:MAG: hypothetical protein Ta2D_04730 [Rickettsiales bacterium]|nr:MAG: hypothetical protein Ta2D_04730 [Rickettsiales bacterium]